MANFKDIILDPDMVTLTYRLFIQTDPNPDDMNFWTGRTLFSLMDSFFNGDQNWLPRPLQREDVKLQGQIDTLSNQIADLSKKIGSQVPTAPLNTTDQQSVTLLSSFLGWLRNLLK